MPEFPVAPIRICTVAPCRIYRFDPYSFEYQGSNFLIF